MDYLRSQKGTVSTGGGGRMKAPSPLINVQASSQHGGSGGNKYIRGSSDGTANRGNKWSVSNPTRNSEKHTANCIAEKHNGLIALPIDRAWSSVLKYGAAADRKLWKAFIRDVRPTLR